MLCGGVISLCVGIASVVDFPIVGVFVVVGHRWGRMIRSEESEGRFGLQVVWRWK